MLIAVKQVKIQSHLYSLLTGRNGDDMAPQPSIECVGWFCIKDHEQIRAVSNCKNTM